MTPPDLIATDDPSEADRCALLAALRAYNVTQVGPLDHRPVAILIKADGITVGGLSGRSAYGWLFIEFLAVPETMRGTGTGTRLMQTAEQIARDRGCTGIWLGTFSFQARGFYEKLGFAGFGTLPDYPAGHQRYFLMKRL